MAFLIRSGGAATSSAVLATDRCHSSNGGSPGGPHGGSAPPPDVHRTAEDAHSRGRPTYSGSGSRRNRSTSRAGQIAECPSVCRAARASLRPRPPPCRTRKGKRWSDRRHGFRRSKPVPLPSVPCGRPACAPPLVRSVAGPLHAACGTVCRNSRLPVTTVLPIGPSRGACQSGGTRAARPRDTKERFPA